MPAKDNDIYQRMKTGDTINFISEDGGHLVKVVGSVNFSFTVMVITVLI